MLLSAQRFICQSVSRTIVLVNLLKMKISGMDKGVFLRKLGCKVCACSVWVLHIQYVKTYKTLRSYWIFSRKSSNSQRNRSVSSHLFSVTRSYTKCIIHDRTKEIFNWKNYYFYSMQDLTKIIIIFRAVFTSPTVDNMLDKSLKRIYPAVR